MTFPTAEEIAELADMKMIPYPLREHWPRILVGLSFALKCEAFLREHGENANAAILRGISDYPVAWDEAEAASDALEELLRSLPRKEG